MGKYEKTVEWLFAQLPMYQRVGKAAYKADLHTTHELDVRFDHPHRSFPTVHVAGTNGKGSVSHMLAAVFQAAGYKTGLYTSPHLIDFRERVRINGEMIPKKEVVSWVEAHQPLFEELRPSFFEMTVALAFDYFRQEAVEMAIVEVGMGGRLDSTNIITPEVSVITSIGKDHMEFLGKTLPEIAGEKAGIMKYGVPVVLGESRPELVDIFKEQARKLKAPVYQASRYFRVPFSVTLPDGRQFFQVRSGKDPVYPALESDLSGMVQRRNLPVVLETIEILRRNQWTLPEEAVYDGIARTRAMTGLRGRWELVSDQPRMVFDTAHNEDGIRSVMQQLAETRFDRLHVVIGVVGDKSADRMLQLLPQDAQYYFTAASIPRSLDVKLLAAKAGYYGLKGQITESVQDALQTARAAAGKGDLIVVTGSSFVVAEGLVGFNV